jgi:hypothetical protein
MAADTTRPPEHIATNAPDEASRRALQARLLPTPFVSSWVGRARPGDYLSPDPQPRAAAWAHWAMGSLVEMTGYQDRSYAALMLPGEFWDPRGTGPKIKPHLEIPSRILQTPAPEFPDRLAEAGAGLCYPWWLFAEVKAVRRALFNTARGSIDEVLTTLRSARPALVEALSALTDAALPHWDVVENLLISSPDGLVESATGDISSNDLAEFFAPAAKLNLEVKFDERLHESQGRWASRRVGVWQLLGINSDGQRFSLGVVTPRLTTNSLFRDDVFSLEHESEAAVLIRAFVMRRLIRSYLNDSESDMQVGPGTTPRDRLPGLRAVPARPGHKLPEASVEAAILFLQSYPDPEDAWSALANWSSLGHMLTITHEGFVASHGRALTSVRRLIEPDREDINVILPLAWDESSKVVRATFARPPTTD